MIIEEIQKLIDISSICEMQCPEWLVNVVVVKKKNGKWCGCIYFIDLSKVWPKDSFPLLYINMLVDATARHKLLKFMDALLG